MGWPGWHDFASEVRYTVNVRKFELVKKNFDFASDTPMSVFIPGAEAVSLDWATGCLHHGPAPATHTAVI